MKNLIIPISVLFCCGAMAAPANNNIFSGMPDYLIDTAHAWAGIYSEFGPAAGVASYITDVQSSDVAQYLNTISILGFNNTAMALFEMTHHISQAFDIINTPTLARRGTCPANFNMCDTTKDTFSVNGAVFGNFAGYDSEQNGDFNTSSTGFAISASGYATDGIILGVEYTKTMTDTHDTRVYSDANGNSITAFMKYISRNGFFINAGANMGNIGWNMDKSIASISDDGVYDTDFYAAQMNMGMRMMRGPISVIPNVSLRYILFSADKYIDDVAQSFDDWWYNTLNASAGVDMGFDFVGTDFIIRPKMYLGGGYDIISRGSENIHVKLIDRQSYDIPVDAPRRALFRGGLEIDVINNYFNAGLNYTLDMRSGYTSHTIMGQIKIAF